MASFWTDLLASLANANTGGRFDVAKAAYGVTPEGRQRRAAGLGVEQAEQGATVGEAGTRQQLAAQLQKYLGQNPDAAGLPFDLQRGQVRNTTLAGDTAQEALTQSKNRFGREMEDVSRIRTQGGPLSEFGIAADANETAAMDRRAGLQLQREQMQNATKEALLRMGIDLAETQAWGGSEMVNRMNPMWDELGLPQMKANTGPTPEQQRAAQLHSQRQAPAQSGSKTLSVTPVQGMSGLDESAGFKLPQPSLKNLMIGGAKSAATGIQQIQQLSTTVVKNLVKMPAMQFKEIMKKVFGIDPATPEEVQSLKQQIQETQKQRQ